MAVKRIESIHNYVGLSTDSKPTGVPVGSTFFEHDSHLFFITYDGTNWAKVR